jgi:hypothetical protein
MYRSGMGEDSPEVGKIDRQGDRAGTLSRPLLSKFDEAFAIEFPDWQGAQVSFQGCEDGMLRPP